jgi:thiol-disulfide isomerase/thioredoxin
MSDFFRFFQLATALACLCAALLLLKHVGLPEQPTYGGYRLRAAAVATAESGAIVPELTLFSSDFSPFVLRPDDERATIVAFWATWCRPCRGELLQLQALHDTAPQRIRIVAINLGEAPATVSRWVQDLGLSIDVLMDPNLSAAQHFPVRGLPTTLLLDRELRIRQIFYGAVSRDQLHQAVNQVGGL